MWVIWKVDGTTIGHGGECNNDVAPIVSTVSISVIEEGFSEKASIILLAIHATAA